MVQKGKFLQSLGIAVFSFGIGMSVFLFLGIFAFKKAMAGDVIFLRTTMPSVPIANASVENSEQGQSQIEQRPVDELYQDDQEAVYKAAQNDQRWRVVRMRVTAYCPCAQCCGKTDGITACNHKIQPGDMFVAADKTYRFGTEMLIPGYNINQPVKVLDRGGAIKGNRLDVFFPSHEIALEWGVRYLDVMVREN